MKIGTGLKNPSPVTMERERDRVDFPDGNLRIEKEVRITVHFLQA